MNYPRLLIISNECLSQSSSNGRTLRNFLVDWPIEKLAQFYIQPGKPDLTVCGKYYRVTDGQALRAFFGKDCDGVVVMEEPTSEAVGNGAASEKSVGRTAATMLTRELVWNSGKWKTESFRRWVKDLAPEVILLQAGDCGFMLRLARELAEQYHAPLVIYNSEDYCFKTYDYFRANGLAHLCYPVFRCQLHRQYKITLQRAAKSIYICQPLQREYDRAFGLPSETVYTATEVQRRATEPENPVFQAVYLGNLGVGRHEGLIEIANALREISSEAYLDVYGSIPNGEVRQALETCPGIRYKGFVSYAEVVRVMHASDLLVHTESFDPFYREDLKFAFSTKLADSLASGSCFLLYSPEEMACAQYLKEHNAAWVVSTPEDLKKTLRMLVEQPAARSRYIDNAASLVARNHNAAKNAARFQDILKQAAKKG